MFDFRKATDEWKNKTVLEGINECTNYSEEDRNQLISLLDSQGILHRKMTGNFFNGMKINEGEDSGIVFSNIFSQTVNSNKFTPMRYALNILKALKRTTTNKAEWSGYIARGLRCLGSYGRELDLMLNLPKVIKGATCVQPTVEQDVVGHTDIFLTYNNNTYRIWSYQMTKNGIKNVSSKIMEDRGRLPLGYHFLLPFDMRNNVDCENVNEWYFYGHDYLLDVKDILEDGYYDYYDEINHYDTITDYVKNINIFYR